MLYAFFPIMLFECEIRSSPLTSHHAFEITHELEPNVIIPNRISFTSNRSRNIERRRKNWSGGAASC